MSSWTDDTSRGSASVGAPKSFSEPPSVPSSAAMTSLPPPQTTSTLTTTSRFRAIVVDSGPIIKETNVPQWIGRAESFYTVPAVIQEIRDARARHQLHQQWIPLLGLQVKDPSAESLKHMVEFSKLTGDYPSLSAVDLQVLALVLDLEREGCLSIEHLRKTPKRTVGLGPITSLNLNNITKVETTDEGNEEGNETKQFTVDSDSFDEKDETDNEKAKFDNDRLVKDDHNHTEYTTTTTKKSLTTSAPVVAFSWAKVVNPKEGSTSAVDVDASIDTINCRLKSITATSNNVGARGRWDNASEGNKIDGIAFLEAEFPTLAAAATVPYEGEKNEDGDLHDHEMRGEEEEDRERRKREALMPISKSGKLYNSFRKYGKLMKTAPQKIVLKSHTFNAAVVAGHAVDEVSEATPPIQQGQSRILGAGGYTWTGSIDDMKAEEDDGEGWITSTTDIRVLKNHTGGGPMDPVKGCAILTDNGLTPDIETPTGPCNSQRAACTTTDFAIQNVLLQMGLLLLSLDGMQVRRLKSWVLRCGACFMIHTDPVDPKTGLRRMFCSHCGSDMMQRVSASVDGKNGRLKLHFSKKKQNKHTSTRGTKFSLPKPGTGNRFQGDLLLREDQLLTGAWSQKVKKNNGGQSRALAQSIFGKDIASNVGCEATSMPNDIQVGFGRRNPNSAKGRERRGKKKKSLDRACGLRRY